MLQPTQDGVVAFHIARLRAFRPVQPTRPWISQGPKIGVVHDQAFPDPIKRKDHAHRAITNFVFSIGQAVGEPLCGDRLGRLSEHAARAARFLLGELEEVLIGQVDREVVKLGPEPQKAQPGRLSGVVGVIAADCNGVLFQSQHFEGGCDEPLLTFVSVEFYQIGAEHHALLSDEGVRTKPPNGGLLSASSGSG